MTAKRLLTLLMLPALALGGACAPQVLTQPVPVSTDPPGAQLYVDGAPACQTPCRVDLPRNQDHMLTLRKEGYRQQDVAVKRQYQSAKVMLNAINEGVRSNDFFKNASWGLGGGVQSVNRQEDTGEAYVLSPSTLALRLTPLAGFGPVSVQTAAPAAGGGQAPVDMGALMRRMSPGDEQMLENALEGSKSGQPTVWANPESLTHFSLVPEPADISPSGAVVRWFTLAVRQGGVTEVGHAPARRVGHGEWVVDLGAAPARGQMQGQAAQGQGTAPVAAFPGSGPGQPDAPADQGAEDISRAETMRALGQTAWPTAHKSWDMGSSGSTKTSTSYGADGSQSTTTTTTRTSAKASVSVGPGAAVTAIGALQDLFGGGK